MKKVLTILTIVLLTIFSCKDIEIKIQQAEKYIDDSDMRRYVSVLASDEFEGRKPCTAGEEKTIQYLKNEFEQIGLLPAINNSYFQDVPILEIISKVPDQITIGNNKLTCTLDYVEDFLITSSATSDTVNLSDSEIIFAGYGINAPEYNKNDYADIDFKGKTVIVLVNDPGYGSSDSSYFKGNAMTYYGRWTYKYEEAARQGADAIFVIHDTGPAGYPFSVLTGSAGKSELYNKPKEGDAKKCKVEGWLTKDAAQKIFELSGLNYDSLLLQAKSPNFKAIPLNSKWSVQFKQFPEYKTSYNVAGYIKGKTRPDECIVYTAHWDHFGIGPVINGDSIYNGAVDNGTSLAWMLEIAEAFSNLKTKPDRSILFLAVTAEETGMLGSNHYVQNPVFDIKNTICCINNDLMLPLGKMKDIMITGYGQSELDSYIEEVAKSQGRYIFPDPNPQTGMYFRSDQFSFAKVGVPSIFARGNCDHAENGKEWAAMKEKDWLANYYHQPTDEYEADIWNFEGIIEDAKLAFRVGFKLANETSFPKWNEGSEFKKIRESAE